MIWLALIISVLLNCLFVWYIIFAVRKFSLISGSIGDLLSKLRDYREHLILVNSMETYYGDLVLQNLVNHTKSIATDVLSYCEMYDTTSSPEEEGTDPGQEEESRK